MQQTVSRPSHDFMIWRSTNNQYYFVYYDGNYEPLMTSELYETFEGAQRGLQNFKTEMRQYA